MIGFSSTHGSGTGGVVSVIRISGISKTCGTLGISSRLIVLGGGGGSWGGLFVLNLMLLPERCGLCE